MKNEYKCENCKHYETDEERSKYCNRCVSDVYSNFKPSNYVSKTVGKVVKDEVNHPSHYKADNGMEAITVLKAFTAHLSGYEATGTYQVLKYMLRWKKKNGLKDLKKAQWYLNDLIETIEKENKK